MKTPKRRRVEPLHIVIAASIGILISVLLTNGNYALDVVILLLSIIALVISLIRINNDFKEL